MRIKASYHQERLWFIHEFESGELYESGPIYHNIPLILQIEGVLAVGLLEQSLGLVFNRHEALRTRIVTIENELFQQVDLETQFKLQVSDLTASPGEKAHMAPLEVALQEAKRPFSPDLDGEPLIRAVLIKTTAVKSFLVITLHHLVSDYCSLGLITDELARCYQALVEGKSPGLPDLPLQYTDFSQWQRQLPRDFLESLLLYWKRQLVHFSPLEMPTSKPRALIHTFQDGSISFVLPGNLTTAIRAFCKQQSKGCDVLLLAAFKVLLHRYCSQEDIIVGTRKDNRHLPGTKNLVGPVANLLPLRSRIPGTISFMTFVSHLEQTLEQANENQDIPFDRLALELNPQKDMSRTVFFDVLFQYENDPWQIPPVRDLKIKYIETNMGWGKYDLNLLIRSEEESFSGTLLYNREYYEPSHVSGLIAHYKVLLESILQGPDQPVSRLNILTGEERHRLLVGWNRTRANYPEDKTIDQLFEQQVERTPDHTALLGENSKSEIRNPKPEAPFGQINAFGENSLRNMNQELIAITYKELNRKADHLAVLIREQGVKPDTIVAIMLNRSVEMIIGLLGILKAGGAYLPIDPDYPEERINYMLADSSARFLVTTPGLTKKFTKLSTINCQLLMVNEKPSGRRSINNYQLTINNLQLESTNLAYIIYTSGTTGRPKGCIITHRNLVRLFKNDRLPFHFDERDTWVMAHSFCFDFSVWEMYGALLYGGRLIVPPLDSVKDVFLFLSFIKTHQVTILNQTPQAFYALLEVEKKSPERLLNHHLRCVIFGGDKLLAQHLTAWINRYPPGEIQLVNMYGITETTVHVTHYPLKESDIRSFHYINLIGKPLPETTLYILDEFLSPVPVGVRGELFVGGTGVVNGYLNRVTLTARRFFANPHYPGEILYKSGDLGRWLADGNVEYLGRNDDQVKIRGFRIEPAEVQNQLLKHPDVEEAVVIHIEDKDLQTHLCAYLCLTSTKSILQMKEYLSNRLPHYMIPSYFVPVEVIPLTSNNKIDKKRLPDPQITRDKQNHLPPTSPMEKTLAEVWAEVLGIKKEVIGIDDDFFDLGGHSLKATFLIAKLHQKLNVKIPLVELFKAPKIRELTGYIRSRSEDKYVSIKPVEEKEYYPLSPAQKRMYVLQQMVPHSTGYNIPFVMPIKTGQEMDLPGLRQIFEKLVNRHESLRTSFKVVESEPVQRIHQTVGLSIDVKNSIAPGGPEVEEALANFVRPFDLKKAPLVRISQVNTGALGQVLLVDMHHIITDAASQHILRKEFMALYWDSEKELSPLPIQYKDFSEWLNSSERKETIKQQEAFWLKEFPPGDEFPVLNLPTDYPRPLMQSFAGNVVNLEFNARETMIVKDIAKKNDVTLYMCLLAVFNILFSKLSGQEDIILGTPIAARRHADLEGVVGMMVNTLCIRNFPTAHKTFEDFLKEIKERILEAYENQEYPFEDLVDNLLVNRDTSRNPMFDVMFNLMNQSDYPGKINTQEMHVSSPSPGYRHRKSTSRFDLIFSAIGRGEHIYFIVEYSTSLFNPDSIDRFINYLKNIVRCLPDYFQQELSHIPLISEQEKEEILNISRGMEETGEPGKTLHHWFEEQVEKTPDHVALIGQIPDSKFQIPNAFGVGYLTYKELNEKSNQLAHFLRAKGVKTDSVVGLLMERSVEMIIGILAILKAGGAYLPIDPAYPRQRVLSMLNDSEISLLLTQRDRLNFFSVTALKNMKPRQANLIVTPPQPQISDFDRLPLPDRTLIDYQRYHQYIGEAPARHTITLQATRGCPYNCLYCHKIWPKKHVVRSAENIFQEISYAYDAGVRRFVFIDDIFNLDQSNSRRILEKIISSKIGIQLFFPNGFRGDLLTRDFIDLMVQAGTVNLDVALESASPRIQQLIKKNLHLEKFKENIQYIIKKYPQVILEMEMMHGFPTETREEAMKTLDFLKGLKWVHFPNLHVLKIFPNTDMCKLAIENGISWELIERSANLAYHELPETLPFSKSFTRQFQAKFMGEYFLDKERLLHVLPWQMKILSEGELVQKYDSYLPSQLKSFNDILDYVGISGEELKEVELMREENFQAPDFVQKARKYFPRKSPAKDALRILLLDLSQLFSEEQEYMLHHQIEEPLGLLYLMSYLNEKYKDRIDGKVFKSRIDFDSWKKLKTMIFDFKPDLIGIRTLSFYREFFHKTVLMIRQWGVDIPIVVGGPYATSDYTLILQDPHVNAAILGEGELTLGQLLEKMMENNNQFPGKDVLKGIAGIAFNPAPGSGSEKYREILLLDELSPLNQYPVQNPVHMNHRNQHNDLIYVIYTSGSTAKPKGVMLNHGNLANLIYYQFKHTGIDFSAVLQFTTISFDVSAQEIFSTLLAGGCLSLVSRETITDIPALFNVVQRNHIKTLFLPASFLRFVINEGEYAQLIPPDVTHIVTAGEQVIMNEKSRYYLKENKIHFHNHYGPSETHVVTALTLGPAEAIPDLPSIGRPILNTRIYILDKGMQVVPLRVPGELYIAGIQVGRGYLNNPQLTAEKFDHDLWDYQDYYDELRKINKKFLRGSRGQFLQKAPPGRRRQKIYRTGDLARWLPERNIEFLGRIDHQVKIRGFRVELGEIEKHLLNHKNIKEAVVISKNSAAGDVYLCAYFVTSNGERELTEQLKEFLSEKLPSYMVPTYFVRMETIPLTLNRKINRRALPAPFTRENQGYTAPQNPIEEKLVEIWAEVLGRSHSHHAIGINDNFFQLGGHSLNATVLVSKVQSQFKVTIPLAELFKTPSIKQLSEYIKTTARTEELQLWEDENLVLLRRGNPGGIHLFLLHAGSGEVGVYTEFCTHLHLGINCWGLRADRLENYTPMNVTFETLAQTYVKKIKKVQPRGPYYLAGWCLGGTIAFEMARQLEQLGEKTKYLAMINSAPPDTEMLAPPVEFTRESELASILDYLPGKEIKKIVKGVPDIRDLWPLIVNYLVETQFDVEMIRESIPLHIAEAIPDFKQQDIQQLIFYLNIIRTLDNARSKYIPKNRNKTPIYFFGASGKEIPNRSIWNNYTQQPLEFSLVKGSHFSIFEPPDVFPFARIFSHVLKKIG